MMQALISGQAARVVFIEGTSIWYINADDPNEKNEISRSALSNIFGTATDVERIDVKEPKDAFGPLLEKYNLDRGVQMLDIALNQGFEVELREEAAELFTELIESNSAKKMINKYVFASYNTDNLSVDEEFEGVFSDNKIFIDYVSELSAHQVHILALEEALSKSFQANGIETELAEEFRARSIEAGVFADLVRAKSNGEAINSAIMNIYIALSDIQNSRQIIVGWTKPFIEKRTKRNLKDLERKIVQYQDAAYKPQSIDERSGFEKFLAVKAQQEAIVLRIKEGDNKSARRFADQLLSSQLINSGSEYAAKSLSKLAVEARDLGAQSLELEWAKCAVEIAPNDGYAIGILADTYLSLFRLKDAEVAFTRARNCGEEEFGSVGLARTLRMSGRCEEALVSFDDLRANPSICDVNLHYVWLGYIGTLMDVWRFSEAYTASEEAVKLFPNVESIRCIHALAQARIGDLDGSLDAYNAIISEGMGAVGTLNGKAIVLGKLGKFPDALSVYKGTMRKYPADASSAVGYASMLAECGEIEESIAAFKVAMVKFPYNPAPYCGYAEILRDDGRIPEALEVYTDAVGKFKLDIHARNGHANLLKVSNRFKGALKAYDENVRDFPFDLICLSGRADLLRRLGKFEDAINAYDGIIEKYPTYLSAIISKAAVLVAEKRFAEAKALLPEEDPATEDEWIGLHVRGMIAMGEADFDKAIQILQFGLESTPFYRKRRYFKTALAAAYMRKNNFTESKNLLSNPKEPYEHILLVHSLGALGEISEAKSVLNAMNDNFPDFAAPLKVALSDKFELTSSSGHASYDEQWIFDRESELIIQAA